MPCNETLIICGRIYYNKGGKAIKRDAAEKAQKPKARNGARGPRASNPLRSSCLCCVSVHSLFRPSMWLVGIRMPASRDWSTASLFRAGAGPPPLTKLLDPTQNRARKTHIYIFYGFSCNSSQFGTFNPQSQVERLQN
jgi:hypothetical protein